MTRIQASNLRRCAHLAGTLLLAGAISMPAVAGPPGSGISALQPLAGDIRTLGFQVTEPGQVVGTSVAAPEDGGQWTGVRWPEPGSPVILPPLAGDPESVARAANASGQVAGDSGEGLGASPTPKRAVIWEPDGSLRPLPLPSGTPFSSVSDMNARGQVVGRAFGAGFQQAVRWEPDGTATLLTTPDPHVPGNHFFNAYAINARGECAGLYHPAGPFRKPIVWDADGIGRELETTSTFPNGEARALNNRGQAGGFVSADTDHPIDPLPALWDARGRLQVLNLLPGHEAGVVFDIADSGAAVGYSRDTEGPLVPVKWEAGSAGPVALPLPDGFSQGAALSINNRGRIEFQAFNTLGTGTGFILE